MKFISVSLLMAFVAMLMGCATTSVDTQGMVGLSYQDCVKQHKLDAHNSWWTPNLPPDSDMEVTYFLPKGDLEIHFNSQEKITFATFDTRNTTPDERIEQVYKSWGKYVDKKTRRMKSNQKVDHISKGSNTSL